MYIYIYIYIYRERARDTHTHTYTYNTYYTYNLHRTLCVDVITLSVKLGEGGFGARPHTPGHAESVRSRARDLQIVRSSGPRLAGSPRLGRAWQVVRGRSLIRVGPRPKPRTAFCVTRGAPSRKIHSCLPHQIKDYTRGPPSNACLFLFWGWAWQVANAFSFGGGPSPAGAPRSVGCQCAVWLRTNGVNTKWGRCKNNEF